MKISNMPSISQANQQQAAKTDVLRTLKMNVNRTPGLIQDAAPPAAQEGESAKELIIPANSEANTENANAVVEATEPLSPQFAALAKQRRVLQQERRAFEDQKKAFETQSQGRDVISKADLVAKPLQVLLDAGVTYEMLTEAIIANPVNPDILDLRNQVKNITETVDTKFTENENRARQQVIKEMTRSAEQLVATNDEFELVRETNSVPDVIELIERNYDETGEVLDVDEACKLVEDKLFERQQKLANSKKMQGLFQPTPATNQTQQRPIMRTLTNKDTASIPLGRKERALRAWNETLKR